MSFPIVAALLIVFLNSLIALGSYLFVRGKELQLFLITVLGFGGVRLLFLFLTIPASQYFYPEYSALYVKTLLFSFPVFLLLEISALYFFLIKKDKSSEIK